MLHTWHCTMLFISPKKFGNINFLKTNKEAVLELHIILWTGELVGINGFKNRSFKRRLHLQHNFLRINSRIFFKWKILSFFHWPGPINLSQVDKKKEKKKFEFKSILNIGQIGLVNYVCNLIVWNHISLTKILVHCTYSK